MADSHSVPNDPYSGRSSVELVDQALNPALQLSPRTRLDGPQRPISSFQGGADDLTLDEVKNIIQRYRRVLVCCVVAFLLLATVYCVIAKRRFESDGLLEIEKSEVSGLDSMGNASGGPTSAGASDAVDFALTQPTQVKILESDTLALQVIRELDLERTDDYFPKKEGDSRKGPGFLAFLGQPLEPLSVPLDKAPNRRAKALKIFHKRLTIKPVAGTRLISVSYVNPDPVLAAAVVNHLMTDYADFEFEARLSNTNRAERVIGQELQDLKKKTEDLQNNAIRLQRETGLFGEDETHNIVTARLDALNVEATEAETNRILKEAIYNEVKTGDPELITGLNGNSLNGTSGLNQSSMTLLSNLRLQEETLRPQVADYQSRYLPKNPKLIELQAQLTDVEKAIAQETIRVRERAKSDYEIALASEQQAKQELAAQKDEANRLNDKNTAYIFARQDAEGSRALYSDLLQKLRQTNLLEGLKANNVVIVDPGRVASKNDPAKPRIPLILAVGGGTGLVLGIILVLWLYQSGLRFQSVSELARDASLDVIGYLPEPRLTGFSVWRSLMKFLGFPAKPVVGNSAESVARNPIYVDGILALRTSILFGATGRIPQVILTVNTTPDLARSFVGRNLASALASAGARTLYLDADLQPGRFDATAGSVVQLSKVLSREGEQLNGYAATSPQTPPLNGRPSAFQSGPDWLGSERMRGLIQQWRSEYDYIVINVDVALPATEATIIATFSDITLMIVHPGITSARTFKALRRRLTEALPLGARLGVVFDGIPDQAPEFSAFFGQPVTAGGPR